MTCWSPRNENREKTQSKCRVDGMTKRDARGSRRDHVRLVTKGPQEEVAATKLLATGEPL